MAEYQHFQTNISKENVRHVLGISGGKDSAALAIYLKDNYPEISDKMEYFFSDTGAELPEIYSFLDKIEFRDQDIEELKNNIYQFDNKVLSKLDVIDKHLVDVKKLIISSIDRDDIL